MTAFDPDAFAEDWAAAWNARDLGRVLAHFADEIVFSTPKAVEIVGQPTVRGIPELRSYWEKALAAITVLHFRVAYTLWDPSRRALGIVYDREVNQHRDRALELLTFSPDGRVIAGEVFYGVTPRNGGG
jgi:hypothetical protein